MKKTILVIAALTALSLLANCGDTRAINVNEPKIKITEQPADNLIVEAGKIGADNILSVGAVVTEGAILNYQWYQRAPGEENFDAVPGAHGFMFTIPANLKAGTYFYYCEVSARAADPAVSNTVSVSVYDAAITIEILFSVQPADTFIIAGGQGASLTAEAVTSPLEYGDSVKYQWYMNSVNEYTGATVIGGDSRILTIPSSWPAGTYYFYCAASLPRRMGMIPPDTSDIAAIEIVDPADIYITITQQPQGLLSPLTIGGPELEINDSLTVEAEIEPDILPLRYEWFWYTDYDAVGQAPRSVGNAKKLYLTGELGMEPGIHFFYCVISTDGGITDISGTVEVEVILTTPPPVSGEQAEEAAPTDGRPRP